MQTDTFFSSKSTLTSTTYHSEATAGGNMIKKYHIPWKWSQSCPSSGRLLPFHTSSTVRASSWKQKKVRAFEEIKVSYEGCNFIFLFTDWWVEKETSAGWYLWQVKQKQWMVSKEVLPNLIPHFCYELHRDQGWVGRGFLSKLGGVSAQGSGIRMRWSWKIPVQMWRAPTSRGHRLLCPFPTQGAALQHFALTHLQFFPEQASVRTLSYRCQWCLAQCKHFVGNVMKLHPQVYSKY